MVPKKNVNELETWGKNNKGAPDQLKLFDFFLLIRLGQHLRMNLWSFLCLSIVALSISVAQASPAESTFLTNF